MAPLIRAILSNLLGEEDAQAIDIISNEVKIESNGKWSIQYRHPTRFVIISCINDVMLTIETVGLIADMDMTSPRRFCHTVICLIGQHCFSSGTACRVSGAICPIR